MADSRELQLLLTVNDRMSQSLAQIGKSTDQLQTKTSRLDGAVRGLVGAYIGVQGLKMAITGTIGAAIEWESAFAGVRKTVDGTDEQLQAISDGMREMATRIPIASTELARIGEVAGQLGVDAENITTFTETVALLGVTTTMTSEDAANSLARIANIMQISLDQVSNMGSVIVQLGNNFATTENEISDFSLRIAGAGKIAGLTTADVMAIGAAMSSVGVQAEAGGTAVQKVLLSMNEAVLTGNDYLNIFAQTSGMTSAQFQTAWENDAGAAFTAFVEGLGKQGDDAMTTLSDLGLEDQRLIRSFLSLGNAGDLLSIAMDSANQEFIENNALTEEATKRFETTASQVQVMKNNMAEVGVLMGEAFLPAIVTGSDVLVDFAQGWAGANENIKEVFGSIDTFIATIKQMPAAVAEVGAKIGQTLLEVPLLGAMLSPIGNFGSNIGLGLTGNYDIVSPNLFSSNALQARASGGPVSSGSPYLVGENGPELFVPGSSGSIIPNGGSGGVSVNVTVNGDVSGRELVSKVQESIMQAIRTNTKLSL
jgi:TP901 family phage tail tape measure protein